MAKGLRIKPTVSFTKMKIIKTRGKETASIFRTVVHGILKDVVNTGINIYTHHHFNYFYRINNTAWNKMTGKDNGRNITDHKVIFIINLQQNIRNLLFMTTFLNKMIRNYHMAEY